MAITVTEKAAGEVKRIISDQQGTGSMPEKIYLRMRVVWWAAAAADSSTSWTLTPSSMRSSTKYSIFTAFPWSSTSAA